MVEFVSLFRDENMKEYGYVFKGDAGVFVYRVNDVYYDAIKPGPWPRKITRNNLDDIVRTLTKEIIIDENKYKAIHAIDGWLIKETIEICGEMGYLIKKTQGDRGYVFITNYGRVFRAPCFTELKKWVCSRKRRKTHYGFPLEWISQNVAKINIFGTVSELDFNEPLEDQLLKTKINGRELLFHAKGEFIKALSKHKSTDEIKIYEEVPGILFIETTSGTFAAEKIIDSYFVHENLLREYHPYDNLMLYTCYDNEGEKFKQLFKPPHNEKIVAVSTTYGITVYDSHYDTTIKTYSITQVVNLYKLLEKLIDLPGKVLSVEKDSLSEYPEATIEINGKTVTTPVPYNPKNFKIKPINVVYTKDGLTRVEKMTIEEALLFIASSRAEKAHLHPNGAKYWIGSDTYTITLFNDGAKMEKDLRPIEPPFPDVP